MQLGIMLFRNDDSNATRNLASKLSVAMTGGSLFIGTPCMCDYSHDLLWTLRHKLPSH